jgi:hypothetical protein
MKQTKTQLPKLNNPYYPISLSSKQLAKKRTFIPHFLNETKDSKHRCCDV